MGIDWAALVASILLLHAVLFIVWMFARTAASNRAASQSETGKDPDRE